MGPCTLYNAARRKGRWVLRAGDIVKVEKDRGTDAGEYRVLAVEAKKEKGGKVRWSVIVWFAAKEKVRAVTASKVVCAVLPSSLTAASTPLGTEAERNATLFAWIASLRKRQSKASDAAAARAAAAAIDTTAKRSSKRKASAAAASQSRPTPTPERQTKRRKTGPKPQNKRKKRGDFFLTLHFFLRVFFCVFTCHVSHECCVVW